MQKSPVRRRYIRQVEATLLPCWQNLIMHDALFDHRWLWSGASSRVRWYYMKSTIHIQCGSNKIISVWIMWVFNVKFLHFWNNNTFFHLSSEQRRDTAPHPYNSPVFHKSLFRRQTVDGLISRHVSSRSSGSGSSPWAHAAVWHCRNNNARREWESESAERPC